MSKLKTILFFTGGCVLGTAGIYYLCENFRESNHEMLKHKYRHSYQSNKESQKAIDNIINGMKDKPPKS